MSFRRNSKQTGSFMMSTSGKMYETQEDAFSTEEISSSQVNLVPNDEPSIAVGRYKGIFIVILLCIINLINYCDRFTLASQSKFFLFNLKKILSVNWQMT